MVGKPGEASFRRLPADDEETLYEVVVEPAYGRRALPAPPSRS